MVLDIITELRTHSELTKWFLEHKIELTNDFGDLYNAEKTDFALIENYFTAYKAFNSAYFLLIDMQNIAEILEREENNLTAHYQFFI